MNSKKVFLIILASGFFLFLWTLKFGYFFSDDFTWLWHAQKMSNFSDIVTFRMSSFYSPVVNLFYYLAYNLFYYQSAYYFLVAILLHVIISFLLYLLIDKVFKKTKWAFLGALFFLLAGSAYEPIIWIAANIHIFATLFILATIYFYWCFLEKNNFKYFVFSFFSFILALGSKEIASILFLLVVLTLVFFKLRNKEIKIFFYNKVLLALFFLLTSFYGFFQYNWQRNSLALSSGYWNLSFSQFLRFPVVIVDFFIPLFRWINLNNYIYLYIICLGLLILLIYYLRKSLVFWYGFFWMLIASLPTIFAIDQWWMPLSSRYTYLPKIGAIFILVVLFIKLYKNLPKKFSYSFFILIFSYNLFYWINIAQSDYPYVYQSGRSLKKIIEQVDQKNPTQVYMVFPFPFQNNNAHIVGAFSTLINYPEDKIILLDQAQLEFIDNNGSGMVIYWNNEKRSYIVR